MELVDAELKARLESLGQGIEHALNHLLQVTLDGVTKIKEAAPAVVLVKSRPRDWVCAVCGTGMMTTNRSVFIHTCELNGTYQDG